MKLHADILAAVVITFSVRRRLCLCRDIVTGSGLLIESHRATPLGSFYMADSRWLQLFDPSGVLHCKNYCWLLGYYCVLQRLCLCRSVLTGAGIKLNLIVRPRWGRFIWQIVAGYNCATHSGVVIVVDGFLATEV